MPVVPIGSADIVTAIEDLTESDTAKPGDGEQGGRFHLDNQATFVPSSLHLRRGLPIQGIGRPGLTGQVGTLVPTQHGLDGSNGLRMGSD